jgi:hypothetical protein
VPPLKGRRIQLHLELVSETRGWLCAMGEAIRAGESTKTKS